MPQAKQPVTAVLNSAEGRVHLPRKQRPHLAQEVRELYHGDSTHTNEFTHRLFGDRVKNAALGIKPKE